MSSSIPATPKLVPVFSMKLQLQGPPQPLFTNEITKTVSTMAIVAAGEFSTIKNEFGFEFDLSNVGGYDNINIHTEKGYSELDAHLHGKTAEGEDVKIDYYGLFKSSPGIDAVLSGSATSHSFEDSYLSSSPRFDFSGKVPEKLQWLQKENIVGKGHFFIEGDKTFVQYFNYVIR